MNLLALLPHLPWLKDMLGLLLSAATKNKDPEVYAALFLEEVPEEIGAEQIAGLLAPANWFQQLCQLEPRWNTSELYPWIERVRTLILQQVVPGPDALSGGPGNEARGREPQSAQAPAPKPQRNTGEIDRPTRLPSLTGD